MLAKNAEKNKNLQLVMYTLTFYAVRQRDWSELLLKRPDFLLNRQQ